ncbi:zinc-dependent alcohol dehydrogenase [Gaopeijia maritima]|uniref:Alcohol dehydrogenase catalytic domain-containing protein n=1 Tax=Gaopeijia maritima TaxID=3119007 RepID=A0ABU9E4T0_9BACT
MTGRRVRSVSFDVSVPRFLLAKSVGRLTDAVLYGPLSGVSLGDRPALPLPGPDWLRLEVIFGGICGTDIGNLTYSASPAMEPFGSFPAVLGHEILGRVVERGDDVSEVEVGQRVTVDPFIHCRVRGWAPEAWCGSCRDGRHATCENAGEDGPQQIDGKAFAPGTIQGYHRSLPGGWSTEVVVHRSQVFAVDDALSDRAAALMEPLAIGMHAVLNTPITDPGAPALVLGSGPIALATIWALRASGFEGEIIGQIKRDHEAALARSFGADTIIRPGDEARSAMVETGASAYMPLVGDEVWAGGGFPLIFDCVGSGQTLAQSLRYASPRGRIVMLGCAAELKKLDLTFVWAREIEVKGFTGYGRETFRGEERHTFDITHDLLIESGAPVEDMVTHVFPLAEARRALAVAGNRRKWKSVKVLLEP